MTGSTKLKDDKEQLTAEMKRNGMQKQCSHNDRDGQEAGKGPRGWRIPAGQKNKAILHPQQMFFGTYLWKVKGLMLVKLFVHEELLIRDVLDNATGITENSPVLHADKGNRMHLETDDPWIY